MQDTQRKRKRRLYIRISLIFLLLLLVGGCQKNSGGKVKTTPSKLGTAANGAAKNNYDTTMTGVIKEIDLQRKTIKIFDIKKKKDVEVSYTGGTDIKDKYEKRLTMDQMEIGEIVDGYYYSTSKKLTLLNKNKEAWDYSNVDRFTMEKTKQVIDLGERTYQYDENLIISAGTQLIDSIDLNQRDELFVRGIGNQVHSISVTKGHGFIRLKNYDDFVGGTIEVGYGIIVPIVDNMLIVAREGSYRVRLENGDLTAEKNIVLLRDEEITLDMSQYHKKEPEIGYVNFKIDPKGSDLYINGRLKEYEDPVKLNYGKYDIRVSMTGYEDYEGILTIGESTSTIIISLAEGAAKVKDDSNSSKNNNNSTSSNNKDSNKNSNNSTDKSDKDTDKPTSIADKADNPTGVSSSTSTKKTDNDHKITVEAPKGAEVYLNGVLKGTVPISFPKEIGTHTITLSQTGYATKSYTVEVVDDGEDVILNFPEMTKTQTE